MGKKKKPEKTSVRVFKSNLIDNLEIPAELVAYVNSGKVANALVGLGNDEPKPSVVLFSDAEIAALRSIASDLRGVNDANSWLWGYAAGVYSLLLHQHERENNQHKAEGYL